MKKKIIITSGPTNERIDSVMKITNMSTGALGCVFAETFLEEKAEEIEKIFFISTKMSHKPRVNSPKIEYVTIESTQDLIDALQKIFENPRVIADNSGKMSSYEPHLMTMYSLTPKVIGMIKKLDPSVKLVGFKLLDGVSREELLKVATILREKNQADYIVANDLSKIGGGKHWEMIIGKDKVVCECQTKKEIAIAIKELIF